MIYKAGIDDGGDCFDMIDSGDDHIRPEFSCLELTLIIQMYTAKLAMYEMLPRECLSLSALPRLDLLWSSRALLD